MAYRVLENPNVPAQLRAIAANQSVLAHEARKAAQDAVLAGEEERRKALKTEMARHERRWDREAREAAIAAQKRSDEILKSETKTLFLRENPSASERDFERLWPALRDRRLLDRANEAANRVESRRRSSDVYRPL